MSKISFKELIQSEIDNGGPISPGLYRKAREESEEFKTIAVMTFLSLALSLPTGFGLLISGFVSLGLSLIILGLISFWGFRLSTISLKHSQSIELAFLQKEEIKKQMENYNF
jgi:hypothetical protein